MDDIDDLGSQVIAGILDLQRGFIVGRENRAVCLGGQRFDNGTCHVEIQRCSGNGTGRDDIRNDAVIMFLIFCQLRIRQEAEVVFHVTERFCGADGVDTEELCFAVDKGCICGTGFGLMQAAGLMEIFNNLGGQINAAFVEQIDGQIAFVVTRCKFDVGQMHERVDGIRGEIGNLAEQVTDVRLTVVVHIDICVLGCLCHFIKRPCSVKNVIIKLIGVFVQFSVQCLVEVNNVRV